MTALLRLSQPLAVKRVYPVVLLTGYVVIILKTLYDYLQVSSLPFILGMIALPFTINKERTASSATTFVLLACLAILLNFLIPVRTIFYFAISFSLLFLANRFFFKAGFLTAITLLMMSPIFFYAANVFSFPIRLQLTHWAGNIFAIIWKGISTEGNMIYYNGKQFSVDPACMGLNMLVASLLAGVIFLCYHQQRKKKTIANFRILLYLGSIVLLNVVSNLLRIIILVQFSLLPDTTGHEAAGLVCLILYVLLPTFFLAGYMVDKKGRSHTAAKEIVKVKPDYWMHLLLLTAVGCSAYRTAHIETFSSFQNTVKKVAGYQCSVFEPGILKLENQHSLIYIKYIRGFYDSDHNPTMCWRGSGYQFGNTEEIAIGGYHIYTSVLTNKTGEKLYTAWWYSNGTMHTTGQLSWRWQMLKQGKTFAIINVTASSKQELQIQISQILQRHLLQPVFQSSL